MAIIAEIIEKEATAFDNHSRQHIGAIEAPNILRPISLDLLFNISTVLEVDPAKLLTFRE